MRKDTFYIMTSEGIKTREGYIYDSGRNLYGIAKTGAGWDATDIITGALVTHTYRTRAEVVAAITPESEEKLFRARNTIARAKEAAAAIYNAYKGSGRLPRETPEKSEPQQTAKKTRRTIKSRTYNNFKRVQRAIIEKGYSEETAAEISRRIFDDFEKNPQGLPIWSRVDMITEAIQPETAPQTDETTANTETPAETDTTPQRAADDTTTGADSQTVTDPKTGNADDLAEAPQTNERTAPEETPTDNRKAPPRGRKKPHKGGRRGRHKPARSPENRTSVRFSRSEQVFVTPKTAPSYKGIPPGG